MSNSCRTGVSVECAACGRRIDCDAWMIVDLDEHPEMAEQIMQGTLNICQCPHCDVQLALNLPLLLFVSDAPTPFLFSPADGNPEEQNRRHAANIEALARKHLAGIWKEWWLLDGLLALPRAEVIAMLNRTRGGRIRDELADHSTRIWLDRLLSVDSADERSVVERHPDLLDPLATEILRQAIEANRARGETDSVEFLVNYQVLLTRCRAFGIEQAFRDRAAAANRPWNAELARLKLELNRIVTLPTRDLAAVKEGVAVCETLLELLKTESDPETEAAAHGCLALFQLETGETWEETDKHFTKALDDPVLRAGNPTLYGVIALALGDWVFRATARNDDLAAPTIGYLEAALSAAARPQDEALRASLHLTLARAYAMWTMGNAADNLEAALAHAEDGAKYYTRARSPNDWAAARTALANVYFRRPRGERAANLELAISHAEEILASDEPDLAEERAIAHGNLGNYYVHRLAGDRANNLHRALRHYEEAAQFFTKEKYPYPWARQQLNIAHLFLRQPNGIGFDDIETAIQFLERALEVRTRERDPVEWATTKLNLATAYGRRVRGGRRANVAAVERFIDEALSVFTRDRYPTRWAEAHSIAAEVALVGWRDHSNPDVGSMMTSMSAEELDAEDVERGIGHLRSALLVKTRDRAPGSFRDGQLDIATVLFRRQDWRGAHEAYAEAIAAGIELFKLAHSVVGREHELTAIVTAYANDAYCLFELGEYAESFLQLERGKARQLVEALTLSDMALERVDPPTRDALRRATAQLRELEALARTTESDDARQTAQVAELLRVVRAELRPILDDLRGRFPDLFPRDPSLESVLAAGSALGVIIAPLVTTAGGVAFVIPPGATTVTADHVVRLPRFGAGVLDELLQGSKHSRLLAEYTAGPAHGWLAERTGERWRTLIDDTTSALWDGVIGVIVERLRALDVSDESKLVFLPHRGVGLLPVHAARRQNASGGVEYLLDDFTVSYAPGAHMLALRGRAMKHDDGTATLLAAVNPTRDLAFAELEGTWVTSIFADGRRTVLDGSAATIDAVIAHASRCTHVHFCCHGVFRSDDVAESGLGLADAVLTLARVVRELDLRATRLVTLSACETGQTEAHKWPDEFVGLPAAFMQAGARAVISTLWAVEDVSSALLMAQFYRAHLAGTEPSVALRTAQRWLRDVPAGELAKRFREERHSVGGAGGQSSEIVSRAWRRFVAMRPNDRPFAHPFYWGAFTFYEA